MNSSLSSVFRLLAGGALALALGASARAATIDKDNNSTALDQGASWVGGVAPGPGDVALFGPTMTTPNVTITANASNTFLGSNITWGGIAVTGPAIGTAGGQNGVMIGNITAGANTGLVLTLGADGIDMSAATAPLLIGSAVTLSANQTWNISRTANSLLTGYNGGAQGNVTFSTGNANSPFALSQRENLVFRGTQVSANTTMPFDLGGNTLTTTGNGTIVYQAGFTISNGTINVGNGDTGNAAPALNTGGNVNWGLVFSGGDTNKPIVLGSDLTLNVSSVVRFQSNSAPVTSNANIFMQSGSIISVASANNSAANVTTINGNITVVGNSILQASNSPSNGANNQPITVAANLSGNAVLTVINTTTNAASTFVFSGNNAGFNGTVDINGPSGNRFMRLTNANAGSANATWNVAANNTLQIHGVSVQLGTLTGNGNVTGSAAGAVANVGGGTFNGVLGANLSINKLGATNSVLILSGTSPLYTGNTTITSGVLAVSGNISNSTVLVSSFGQLVGSGAVGTITTQPGGIVNPITNLTAANLIWDGSTDASATLILGLSNTDNSSDTLTLGGNFTKGITGTSFVFDFDDTGNALGAPTVYTLITFGGSTDFSVGDFSYIGLAAGLSGTFGLNANSLTLTVSVVPEPAEWAALFGACALLAALRRRRAQA